MFIISMVPLSFPIEQFIANLTNEPSKAFR